MTPLAHPMVEAADKNYLVTGAAGTILGWGGAIVSKLAILNDILTTLGGIFGTVAAFFTMLILIRKWIRNKD